MKSAPNFKNKERISEWLNQFSLKVRNKDFVSAYDLFLEDVKSFGTVINYSKSLDELANNQWRKMWNKTEDFKFLNPIIISAENPFIVISEWQSTKNKSWLGLNGDFKKENNAIRNGRASIVLIEKNGKLKASHTHFSISPIYPI